jgi:hypothetical protein
MELSNLSVWFFSALGSTGLLVSIGYLSKDVIFKYYEKKIALNFEKELEHFKSEIRRKEKSLEDELKRKDSELIFIRDSLMNFKKERLTALNSKKLLAYESMYETLKFYNQTAALTNMLKVFDLNKALDNEYKQSFQQISETLFNSFGIEKIISEMNSKDEKYFQLYLNNKILENFKRFKEISVHSILLINLLKMGLLEKKILNNDSLLKSIIELVPSAEKGFKEYGDQYALYWHDYFYNQVVTLLRLEILGTDAENSELNIVKDINKSAFSMSGFDEYKIPCDLILSQEMRPNFNKK